MSDFDNTTMGHSKILWCVIIFSIIVPGYWYLSGSNPVEATQESPGRFVVPQSTLDQNALRLRGAWSFAWHEETCDQISGVQKEQYLSIPGNWANRNRTGNGCGLYETTLTLPNVEKEYSLLIENIYSDYRIEVLGIDLGTLRSGPSSLGHLETREHTPNSDSVKLDFIASNEITLRIWVTNFEHARGGIRQAPLFGSPTQIHRFLTSNMFRSSLLMGMLIMVAIYNFSLFLVQPKHLHHFCIALLSLVIAARTFVGNSYFGLSLEAPLNFEVKHGVRYFSAYFGAVLYIYFLNLILPKPLN